MMNDFCPSCGRWTDALDWVTGWCAECSPPPASNPTQTSAQFQEEWLEKHADEIEAWMVAGNGLSKAKRLVATYNVPLCHCCGNPIKGGKDNHLFCTTTTACRSSQRRYRTLRERHARQNPKSSYEDRRAVALQQIVRELNERKESTNGNDGGSNYYREVLPR